MPLGLGGRRWGGTEGGLIGATGGVIGNVWNGGEVTREDDEGRQAKGTIRRVGLRTSNDFKFHDFVSSLPSTLLLLLLWSEVRGQRRHR